MTYEQVRNSSLGKQIFYNKPFVITQKTKETIAVSFYLVQMMIADGLYWLIRDYYHNNHWGQKFINAFGEMFEDYLDWEQNSRCRMLGRLIRFITGT